MKFKSFSNGDFCLNKVPCGNGQFGYGRRRRSVPYALPPDPNKVFEVEMTAFLKVANRIEEAQNLYFSVKGKEIKITVHATLVKVDV